MKTFLKERIDATKEALKTNEDKNNFLCIVQVMILENQLAIMEELLLLQKSENETNVDIGEKNNKREELNKKSDCLYSEQEVIAMLNEAYDRGYDDGYSELYNEEFVGSDFKKQMIIKGKETVISEILDGKFDNNI